MSISNTNKRRAGVPRALLDIGRIMKEMSMNWRIGIVACVALGIATSTFAACGGGGWTTKVHDASNDDSISDVPAPLPDEKPGVVSFVKVVSDKVPDVSSLEAWKSSFIKDGMSDQEKALTVWKTVAM